jgi:ethanolamine utilization protein EutN
MKLAMITGTATATLKDAALSGAALLIADVVDGKGKVLEAAIVAADTVGAGVGDTVLIATGSAARLPAGMASAPIDATVIAIVEHVNLS